MPLQRVVLFEDDDKRAKQLLSLLRRSLRGQVEIKRFEPATATGKGRGELFETRLEKDVGRPAYRNTILFITDRDLSKTPGYTGLSEAAVVRVADAADLPVVLYAQGASFNVLDHRRGWGDGSIVLKGKSTEDHAAELTVLVKGFLRIRAEYRGMLRGPHHTRSPAALMAELMGRPRYLDRVAQYGLGDQKYFAEIVPLAKEDKRSRLEMRLVRILGTWLYDSILRFPGLLVSGKAAASYLDIDPAEFEGSKQIERLFVSARYRGPFSEGARPIWWRPDLDDLLLKARCESGRALVKKKLRRDPGGCKCSVDASKRAGFFCMVTEKPVSDEESEAAVSWFPPGADLARINKKVFEELRPWLASY